MIIQILLYDMNGYVGKTFSMITASMKLVIVALKNTGYRFLTMLRSLYINIPRTVKENILKVSDSFTAYFIPTKRCALI